MATPERLRMLVLDLARGTWGDEGAEALMELLPPPAWSEVARQSDLAELRGEIAELRGRIDSLWGKVLVGQVTTTAVIVGAFATITQFL